MNVSFSVFWNDSSMTESHFPEHPQQQPLWNRNFHSMTNLADDGRTSSPPHLSVERRNFDFPFPESSSSLQQVSLRRGFSPAPPGLPPWKPVLYLKQPYPDHYVDPSFLSSLVTNGSLSYFPFLSWIYYFLICLFCVFDP